MTDGDGVDVMSFELLYQVERADDIAITADNMCGLSIERSLQHHVIATIAAKVQVARNFHSRSKANDVPCKPLGEIRRQVAHLVYADARSPDATRLPTDAT